MTETLTYRDALRAFADGKTLEKNVGPRVWALANFCGGFSICDLDTMSRYRIRQSTITINGVEVPEPMRAMPPHGTEYFVPIPTSSGSLFFRDFWYGSQDDTRYLRRGLCHLTREAAEAHARALILASGGQL